MLRFKTYTCKKCGKKFTKSIGGIITTPSQMELDLYPVCDQCKLKTIGRIFTGGK